MPRLGLEPIFSVFSSFCMVAFHRTCSQSLIQYYLGKSRALCAFKCGQRQQTLWGCLGLWTCLGNVWCVRKPSKTLGKVWGRVWHNLGLKASPRVKCAPRRPILVSLGTPVICSRLLVGLPRNPGDLRLRDRDQTRPLQSIAGEPD